MIFCFFSRILTSQCFLLNTLEQLQGQVLYFMKIGELVKKGALTFDSIRFMKNQA